MSMMAITLEFADADYPIFSAEVCITKCTFHLNIAIVLLIRNYFFLRRNNYGRLL